MVKAAEHSRDSTEDQAPEGYSIEAQESVIRECCKNHGWEFFKLYSDPGISGTVPPEDRPGLAELMDDSKKSLFDIVLVVNFDRLSRDSGDASYIRKEVTISGRQGSRDFRAGYRFGQFYGQVPIQRQGCFRGT